MANNNALKRRCESPDAQRGDDERIKQIRWYEEEQQVLDDHIYDADLQIRELQRHRTWLLGENDDIAKRLEQERVAQYTALCHDLVNAMMTKLPRELRDMIYGHMYERPISHSPGPFESVDFPRDGVVISWISKAASTIDSEYDYDSPPEDPPIRIQGWKLPMYLRDSVVGSQFASEVAESWYRHVNLVMPATCVPLVIEDEIGALGSAGAPARHIPREHLRQLTVTFDHAVQLGRLQDPIPWTRSRQIRKDASSLKALLGPFGVKFKKGFDLQICISCVREIDLERWLEALGPAIYACKEEGFMVRVFQITDYYDGWQWITLHGARQARSRVMDVSRRFDRPFSDWKHRAALNCFLAPPVGRDCAGKQNRLLADSQYDKPIHGPWDSRPERSCSCGRDDCLRAP